MLSSKWTVILAVGLSSVAAGCGQSEKGASTATAASAKNEGPDRAVAQFLEAVKTGNDAVAASMLTKVARQKTTEMQLVVAPPGSPTAGYQVGEVEFIGSEGAHVASTWTDIAEDGKPHTDTIVWILRRDPEGWRIAGMGTRIFADQGPLLLNFEDPEDMIRKQRLAEEEMQRRAQNASQQAKRPAPAPAPQR